MYEASASGRVFSASLPQSVFRDLFGEAEGPILMFDFAVYFDCSLPRETRILAVVDTPGGGIVPAADSTLAMLAGVVKTGRHRVEADVYQRAAAAAREHLAQRLPALVAELEDVILAERHRRRRKLDTVFDLRLADAEGGTGPAEDEEVARLLNEKRMAVRHAEAHYDPESLHVVAETELVLLLGVGS